MKGAPLLIVAFLLAGAAPGQALAQAAPCSSAEEPRVFLQECRDQAQAQEQAGDLRGALAIYRQAYQRVPTPRLLWQMANLHLRLQQPVEGLEVLDRYVAEMPEEEIKEMKEQTDAVRRQLEQMAREAEPTPAPLTPPPAARPAPVAPPRPAPQPRSLRPLAWTGMGVGIFLMGAGAALVGVDGRFGQDCEVPGDLTSCPRILSTLPAGSALLGGGAALLVGATVLLALDDRRERARPRLTWAGGRLAQQVPAAQVH